MSAHPAGPVNRHESASIAAHAAVDACSYTWTESLAAAFARVGRWMTPAGARGWLPTTADRSYWTGHVVPARETVTCQVTGSTTDGPNTPTHRGISTTLATTRTSNAGTERGVSSYAVLLDRAPQGTWQVAVLTGTG